MTGPQAGMTVAQGDGVRCILAPNPGPMTYWGTNTWILGEDEIAIIDPGPASEAHLDAILSATCGQRISHILVTHAHSDHSPLARQLADRVGAPVYGFGPPEKGRAPIMEKLATTDAIAGGEGVDRNFCPDIEIEEGHVLTGGGWSLTVRHVPGHFAGHLAFQFGTVIFSGDHVLDWASTLVSPPDGHMGEFFASSERLRNLAPSVCLPGHGVQITDPQGRLEELVAHRRARETAILNAVAGGKTTLGDITAEVYADIPLEMHRAASRNALAHLIDLVGQNALIAEPDIGLASTYRLS